MSMATTVFKSGAQLSPRSILIWRIAQTTVWLVGATILFLLLFMPPIGILVFWDILIPVAPALLGFGKFDGDGLLINLRSVLPAWGLTAATIATTLFFFYWLVIRNQNNKSWVIRPQFAVQEEKG